LGGSGTDSTGNPTGLSFGIATVLVQVAFNPSNKAIPTYTQVNGDPNSCLFNTTGLPGVMVRNYCAQVGRND
jgi:hypothetical protein